MTQIRFCLSVMFVSLSDWEMFAFIISVGILAVLCMIYWVFTKNNNYWKDRGIPYIKPVFFYGSIKNEVLSKASWKEFPLKCYKQFKNQQYGGVFLLTFPALYVCDLKIIEKILVEDFSFFKDRWVKSNNHLSESLTFGKGDQWRERRLKLAPAFSSARVRGMFQQISSATECTLKKIRDHHMREEPLEAEHFATAFSIDVISSCLFGVNMLDSYESILLRKALDQIFTASTSHTMVYILGMKYPKVFDFLNILKGYREVIGAYDNVIKDIIIFRMTNNFRRNDILQVMLDLQKQEEEKHGDVDKAISVDGNLKCSKTNSKGLSQKLGGNLFSCESIGAIMHNFIHGGIKPTAQTSAFALFEIARNPEIQNCVLKEIESSIIKYKGWNADALEHMTYLDQVIQETLRLYSFNATLFRVLTKPYNLPGTNVTLEEGMHVFVPIDAIHRDPEFYPEPDQFRPERFKGHNYKPTSTFLPFGQGPRICVAIRLAVTTVKLCLARILAQYEVKISDKMQLPLELSGSEFYPRAKGGIWLQFVKRENPV